MLRRLVGLAFVVGGAYLAYQSWSAIARYATFSGDWPGTLADPAFLMRGIGSVMPVIAGLLALAGRGGAPVFSGVGLALFGGLAAAIMGQGGDQSLWIDEAVTTAILAIGTLLLLVLKRQR